MLDEEYEGLNRLLGALAESVASRIHLDESSSLEVASIPGSAPAEWGEKTTSVQVDTLPRGVPLRVVARGVLGNFLPAASVVVLPLVAVSYLFSASDPTWKIIPLSSLFLSTLGFGLGLGALSPWLYPHSNPDGRLSEVAGFLSPFAWMILAAGLKTWQPPLFPGMNLAVGLVPGMGLAVLAYAPWLRRSSRIAPTSPPGRWAKLRAVFFTGGLGSVTLGAAFFLSILPRLPAAAPQKAVLFMLGLGASFGFVVGGAFAILLAIVYRHHAVQDLRAWKVGLWGAFAAVLAPSIWAIQWPPIFDLRWVLLTWILPGFLMGYGAVKLAQQSGQTD